MRAEEWRACRPPPAPRLCACMPRATEKRLDYSKTECSRRKCIGDAAAKTPCRRGAWGPVPVAANLGSP